MLNISLLHTEVYASPNPDSDIPLVVSENVKVESIKYSEKLGGGVPLDLVG